METELKPTAFGKLEVGDRFVTEIYEIHKGNKNVECQKVDFDHARDLTTGTSFYMAVWRICYKEK